MAVPGFAQQGNPARPATRHPYIIEIEEKREQTLADGTHIVRVSREKHYGDSQGRTRVDYFVNSDIGDSPRTNVLIFDPVKKVTFSWVIGDHMESTYTVSTMHSPNATDVPHQSSPSTTRPAPKLQRTNESLGMQEVQGFACLATRSTVVYPIGVLGNDRPITNVSEHCMSKEFNLQLSASGSDPRSGTYTLTAQSISREEPDPSTFLPPPGFIERKVVSVTPTEAH
ncbi:hypothetical protein [Terriglobus roseus]|nr:hypothetical protein [Terriglobus roseus]